VTNNHTHLSTNSSRRRFGAGLVVTALTAVGLPLAAISASALLDPNVGPAAPHSIIVFPARDFVHLDGYAAAPITMNVVRGGFVVGTTMPFTPDQADPKTPNTFMADINHAGPPCWSGVTPDIRAGDVIQVLDSPTTGDETTTAGVTVTQEATKVNATTVTVKGDAPDAASPLGRIDINLLEARIVANKQLFVASGARTLRAGPTGPIAGKFEGNLAYDSPTATTWTATYTGLGAVSAADGISDADRAVASESRGQWLGRVPLAVNENTIYEYGPFPGALAFPGPALGCNAPLASGPSVHMTIATDSGASSSDGVTSNVSPAFAGVASQLNTTNVNLYVDGVLVGTQAVGAGGSYSLTPTTALTDGPHTVTAGEMTPSIGDPTISVETMGNAPQSIMIDSAAPAAPVVTMPASPGISTVPPVKGTAEAGSTVSLYTNTACTAPAAGSSSAAAFASTGISTPVTAGSTTSFFATATDLAGNMSACSTGAASYLQDSVSPIVTTIAPATNALGVSQAGNVNVMFNESVVGVNGITFTLRSGGSLVGSTVSYNNVGGATLQPTAKLAAGTTYAVGLTSAITDAAGNPITALGWSFTTGPRPTVARRSPATNATGVVQLANTTATFSENVTGVSPTSFTLRKTTTGAIVGATVSYNAATHVATLNPTATLLAGTRYTATLSGSIIDADGNPITAMSWSFVTGPRPTVIRKSPGANARGVRRLANATATFSENVGGVSRTTFTLKKTSNGRAVTVTVSYNSRTHVATLNPSVTLARNTTYTATLGSRIKDSDGNPITAMSWRFTTGR